MLSENCVLVSFDVVNMFSNIDNKSGLLSVKEVLTNSNFDVDITKCIADALEICLTCNNSKFNHQHFLQTDGTAQGPHTSCSYAEIAMTKYDSLADKFHLKPSVWKRFRDDVFVLWEHGVASLSSFLDYLNTMDKTGKINFTMEIAGEIKTKKDRCGTARHFNTKCSDVQNPDRFLQVQLIQSVLSDLDLENKL